jgi:hypothetical protein
MYAAVEVMTWCEMNQKKKDQSNNKIKRANEHEQDVDFDYCEKTQYLTVMR